MRSLLTFMLLAAAMTPALVLAGPFGYEMGQAISGEPDGLSDKGLLYQNSPKEFAGWEEVLAYYTHETGVCEVRAYRKVSNGDAFGYGYRKAADSLVETLTKKYRAFEKFDFLIVGSIWDEPNEWLAGIRKDERKYIYVSEDLDLEGDLKEIQVKVVSFGLQLSYAFDNYDACIEAASEAALSDL